MKEKVVFPMTEKERHPVDVAKTGDSDNSRSIAIEPYLVVLATSLYNIKHENCSVYLSKQMKSAAKIRHGI